MTAYGKYFITSSIMASFAIFACGSADLLVGDDSHAIVDAASTPDTSLLTDSSAPQPDAAKDTGVDAPLDGGCSEVAPPPPGFCDGGPYVPIYDAKACIVGFGCAPLLCANAGGKCAGLAPGTCASNHIGDATKYSCGGGIGVACCLP